MMKFVMSVLYELQPVRLPDIFGVFVAIGQIALLFGKALIVACKSMLKSVLTLSVTTLGIIVLWTIGAFVSHRFLDTLSLYIMATMFAMIFLNLGERKAGELSAYSVFNDGFEEILGTLNANQFDREIRHNMMVETARDSDNDEEPDYYIPTDDEGSDDDDEQNTSRRSTHPEKDHKSAEKKDKDGIRMDDDEDYIEMLQRREIAKKVQIFQLMKKFDQLDAKLMISKSAMSNDDKPKSSETENGDLELKEL